MAGNGIRWRRSSRCTDTNCLEIAAAGDDVLLRRTVNGRSGRVLQVGVAEWAVFEQAVRDGEFSDLERPPE